MRQIASYNIINTINLDPIVKAAQIEKVKIAFSDMSEAQLQILIDEVESNGGRDSLNRTELMLTGEI